MASASRDIVSAMRDVIRFHGLPEEVPAGGAHGSPKLTATADSQSMRM
jgi:hypothetical protein